MGAKAEACLVEKVAVENSVEAASKVEFAGLLVRLAEEHCDKAEN